MASPDMTALFQAGAHYGHKTSRWHPKMAPYIHGERGGIHIIDLAKTVEMLDIALGFLSKTTGEGKQVLIIGTKRQAAELVEKLAADADMPYVSVRWFGGLLTNFKTMQGRVKHLKSLEEKMASGELANRYSKLEVQRFQEEIDRLNYDFGGIKNMSGLPGAVFVTDASSNELAVHEAKKLGIPVVAIVDTNVDPTDVDYPIPANDDAIKSVALILTSVAEALVSGRQTVAKKTAAASVESEAKVAVKPTTDTKEPAAATPKPAAGKSAQRPAKPTAKAKSVAKPKGS